jgi:tRNA(Arg) A34 adenosine deaminase TadA
MRPLNLAIKIAKSSNHPRSKHGAVLIRGGAIMSVAKNTNDYTSFGQRFRPLTKHGRASRHAEIACVLGVDKSITKGSTLYVARVNKSGEIRNSKPCEMCAAILEHTGVKRVFYTTNDGWGCVKY